MENGLRTFDTIRAEKYTAADLFYGVGGASRGMERAGFRVTLAVDHWADAYASYCANFRGMKLLKSDVFDYINAPSTGSSGDYRDVVYLSLPC
jgi:DNA (cytosine-5)-methyltransferase 1